jgi:hypothetical protein
MLSFKGLETIQSASKRLRKAPESLSITYWHWPVLAALQSDEGSASRNLLKVCLKKSDIKLRLGLTYAVQVAELRSFQDLV